MGLMSSRRKENVFLCEVTSQLLTRCRNNMRQLVGAKVGTMACGHEIIFDPSLRWSRESPIMRSSPLKTVS